MARKPWVEFEGAFYHVIVRGNQRQKIFRDDRDRIYYLERVEHYRQRCQFTLYASVLMSNHVHLLLETGKTPLSKILQGIQFTYTQYYNRRYGTTGHLFQGRYKAILCDRDAYLLELVRYIHLNPVPLKHPEELDAYQWSSHAAYLEEGDPSPSTPNWSWADWETLLARLSKLIGNLLTRGEAWVTKSSITKRSIRDF